MHRVIELDYGQLIIVNEAITPRLRSYLKPETFGRGGLPPGDDDFFKLSELEQTLIMLWQNGCRVPLHSIIDNKIPWMRERAAETNFLFSVIRNRAQKLNPALYKELSEPRERRPNEPMPKDRYEVGTGPADNDKYIYPMQGIFGFSASRVLSEIIGRREKGTTPSIFVNAMELLDSVIKDSSTPSEFVARLAGGGYENGASAIPMLSHIFPNGILTEQNCFQDYRDFVRDLAIHAPKVLEAYQTAHSEVLMKNDIAPMSRFIS